MSGDNEEMIRTSVYLRVDQLQHIQMYFSQEFSQIVRNFIDSMILELDAGEYPPGIAEDLITLQNRLKARKLHSERKKQLKQEFFSYLDNTNYPVIIAGKSKRVSKQLGRDFVAGFRMSGHILPEKMVSDFLNEYIDYVEYSGKIFEVWAPVQEQMFLGEGRT